MKNVIGTPTDRSVRLVERRPASAAADSSSASSARRRGASRRVSSSETPRIDDALVLVLGVGLDELGDLELAGAAPRRPEVQQDRPCPCSRPAARRAPFMSLSVKIEVRRAFATCAARPAVSAAFDSARRVQHPRHHQQRERARGGACGDPATLHHRRPCSFQFPATSPAVSLPVSSRASSVCAHSSPRVRTHVADDRRELGGTRAREHHVGAIARRSR